MAMEHGTALGAMSALRSQIEERLLQNDDFRALRALDRAISDLQMPARPVILSASPALQVNPVSMSAGLSMPTSTIPDSPSALQQKISAKFSGSAA